MVTQAKTSFARQGVLNHFFAKSAWTFPTAIYLGLFSGNPFIDGISAELSSSGYARIDILPSITRVTGTDYIINTALIQFGPNTGSTWPAVNYVGVLTTSGLGTGSVLYAVIPQRIVSVLNGATYDIKVGGLIVREF